MTTLPLTALLVSILATPAGAIGQPEHVRSPGGPEALTAAIATVLTGPDPLVVDGRRLDARRLRQLYEPRGYRPVWFGDEDAADRATQVASALSRAEAHGLDPTAYHIEAIVGRGGGAAPVDRGAADVLASDAVMELATHLRLGALRPGATGGEVAVESRPIDPQALALEAAAASDLGDFLDALAPQDDVYRGLMDALARQREIARAGGWPVVPAKGTTVRPGESDPVVALVRQRLAVTGELAAVAAASPDPPALASSGDVAVIAPVSLSGRAAPPSEPAAAHYDDTLAAAVKTFQARAGLPADGVLGPATRAALGMAVTERIDQLVANLERARWFGVEPARRWVSVNVASFDLSVIEDGEPVLTMPVVVGRKDRQTPLLSSHITELIFNPSWTVPPTLLREDFLPKMRRNQSYAARRGLQVVGSKGLNLRQPPGPRNPLGKVKFSMPNGFAVYLHDTNAKGLMQQSRRALSSGCVRLGDPIGLANRLLADDPRWTPASRKGYLAGWTTRYLALRTPVPVRLEYRTAWIDRDGALHVREDIYGRDAALARALGQGAQPRKPARGA